MNETFIYSESFMIKAKELDISKICPEELDILNILVEYLPFKAEKIKWTRGKVISNITNSVLDVQLKRCENPWKKDDKVPIDIKNITAILNKLTEENYEVLLKETMAFNYSDPIIVKKIFKKVLGEPFFAKLYAKFCEDLVDLHPILEELYIQEFNENKHKNLAVFIGELYKIELIEDINIFITILKNDLTDSNLEILCTLITVIGIKNKELEEIISHLNSIKNNFKPRYKFMILDIIEKI